MTRLNESLINKLRPDIRQGLNDTRLRKKHGIPKSTWRRWKNEGQEDRENGRQTLRTMLLDEIRAGREELTRQIENVFVKVALGEWRYVTTTTHKDTSGEIVQTVETITTRPDFYAAEFLLRYLDPERWGEHKKTEPPYSAAPVTYSVEDDPWLAKYGNKGTNRTQPKEAEKQPEQPEQPKQPKQVVKPIEWAVIEMALGIRKHVSTEEWKDESGKIIGTVELTTTLPPDIKAAERWLSHRDPERWSKKKKPVRSIATLIPDSGILSKDEWLIKYGNKQTNSTQPKEAEKQPEQKEKDEAE